MWVFISFISFGVICLLAGCVIGHMARDHELKGE